jgi:hypothetical protein
VARVGRHEPGLGREDQVVGGADGPGPVRGHAAQAEVERPDVVGQVSRADGPVRQPQLLDPLQQRVGLGQHPPPVDLGGIDVIQCFGECAHGRQSRGKGERR